LTGWPGLTAFGVVAPGFTDGAADVVPTTVATSPCATVPEKLIVAPVAVVEKLICSPPGAPAAVFALALQVIDVDEG
jgi:hypothetical protein